MNELWDYFLKWFIPFACAGLFALLVKPVIETFKQGHKIEKQEEWNNLSIKLKTELSATITSQIGVLQKELADKTNGIREAILNIHLDRLIGESILYIQRGYITSEELKDYQSKYDVYVELGGNGHMDPWYPKVLNLPVHDN